jgi:hypothetical protein
MASYLQNNLLTIPIHQFSIATFFLMGGIWLQSFTSHAIFLTMPSLLAIIIILMLLSLLKKIHWDTLVRYSLFACAVYCQEKVMKKK